MDIHINVNQVKRKHMFDIELNLFGIGVNNRGSETEGSPLCDWRRTICTGSCLRKRLRQAEMFYS